jgi:DNA-binding transcriptional MerR regulator
VQGWSAAEVARASGVPVRTLRGWERSGRLVPTEGPDDEACRWYGHAELVALQRILVCAELGLPDDDRADSEHLVAVLEAVRARLDRQIVALRAGAAGAAPDPMAMFDGFGDDSGPVGEALDDLGTAWARAWAAGEAVDSATARALAARHRSLAGPDVTEAVAAVLDRHALGAAAYARDALAAALA